MRISKCNSATSVSKFDKSPGSKCKKYREMFKSAIYPLRNSCAYNTYINTYNIYGNTHFRKTKAYLRYMIYF